MVGVAGVVEMRLKGKEMGEQIQRGVLIEEVQGDGMKELYLGMPVSSILDPNLLDRSDDILRLLQILRLLLLRLNILLTIMYRDHLLVVRIMYICNLSSLMGGILKLYQ